jgi:predicted DNA-binding protein (MmcQ/YjbR family)
MTTGGAVFATLRAYGLAFPETVEDFPWGHCALKVRGKTFAWLDETDEILSLTVKLPASRDFALVFDFAEPAGYGLGRSGWISCRFAKGEAVDLDLIKRWLAESYRAVAPKKLAALIGGSDGDTSSG